jgi:hypothetical protein
MNVTPCRPYYARIVDRSLAVMATGKSRFKVYFVSIVGRDQPERYEWAHCGLEPAEFVRRFSAGSEEGVGFVTAFPHITKVFRFAPEAETLLNVRAFNTRDLTPIDLGRPAGYVEFACYAEAALAADEYHAWARARSVAEYLDVWSAQQEAPIADNAKMRTWWTAG